LVRRKSKGSENGETAGFKWDEREIIPMRHRGAFKRENCHAQKRIINNQG